MVRRHDLVPQLERCRDEVMAAIERVLATGRYVLGEEGEAFEAELAAYLGRAHGVGVNSGTDALVLALRAAGLAPGDGVLVPVYGPTPTPAAVIAAGGRPVFADVEAATGLLDPAEAERRIDPGTRFLMPVHLFGRVCDMAALADLAGRRELVTIEDAAQAVGSRLDGRPAGGFGALACFSFYPTKNLGAFGDGGMVVTDRDDLAARLRLLRNYGKPPGEPFDSVTPGVNSRLDELQAAVLRVKLAHLDGWNREREERVDRYREGLAGTPARILGDGRGGRSNHHVLTVVCGEHRDALARHLEARGIQTHVYYPEPLHRMAAYRAFVPEGASFPAAETLSRESLALPLYPELPLATVDRVVEAVREHFTR